MTHTRAVIEFNEDTAGEAADFVGMGIGEKGMSTAAFAREAGVSEKTITKLLAGEPGKYQPGRLSLVSMALGAGPDALAKIADGEPPGPRGFGGDAQLREAIESINENLVRLTQLIESAVEELRSGLQPRGDDRGSP